MNTTTTTSAPDSLRAAFEQWVRERHPATPLVTLSPSDDRYLSVETALMWSAWQAANAVLPACPAGEVPKVVIAKDVISREQYKPVEPVEDNHAVGRPSGVSQHPWANDLRELLARCDADQELIDRFATQFDLALADKSRDNLTLKDLLDFATSQCVSISYGSITFHTWRDGYVTIVGDSWKSLPYLLTAGIQYSSDADGTEIMAIHDRYCCGAGLGDEDRERVRNLLRRHRRTYVYDANVQEGHDEPDWTPWGDEMPARQLLASEMERKDRIGDMRSVLLGESCHDPCVKAVMRAMSG